MHSKKLFLLSCIFILFLILQTQAQEDCAFTLTRAQRMYEAGNIEQIPQMLAPCIENGFTTEEKQQAQKLIVLSYLFDKNDTEAEKAMLEFLNKYPEYELNVSDQAEFVQLFNSYLTLPIVSIGVVGGFNYASVQQGEIYSPTKYPGSFSGSTPGFQGGLSFRFYLKNKLDLNIEALYLQTIVNYKNDSTSGGNSFSFVETRTSLSFPISIIYTPILLKKINPFLRIGVNFEYLLNSEADYNTENAFREKPINNPKYPTMDNRNNFQVQALGGLGITYKLKRSYILLEARYNYGFMPQTKGKTQYNTTNMDSWSINLATENDYSLSHLTFNLGLFYKIYKPRKK